ncbi:MULTISPECIES: FAD-binding oxidoreductase [Mycobacteriaceae]|uniref:FAD-binding oxidoreductase n=1 Tax=Mycolicibacterium parafortuitum TaxID=39692 RepID=A0ACC6MQ31_MYCPF|nr:MULTISPECIES: FAD-binding oxidoreductase [Mycobacteriaceae]MDZ5089074.1 FAD-binding oxidoreductase [Mycolicibacterium parafortuitum]GFM18791.1 FAD linked oxidase domain-containing protein [Mycobacterium sp. PO1]GFM26321.1 FAD linked oxidase domain-containing protein [Mycobacterium sp. PO2]
MTVPTDLSRADTLRTLREQVNTHVALPGEPGYERCMPWNVAAAVTPAAVVLATTPEDVAGTVRFAAEHGFTVTVQSTGHGAVGVGDETILVQTSAMKHCEIDVLNRTARVGAGARWQDVIAAAAPHGLAPLCGSSPSVGVVGFLTGCGIGPLVRTVGLSSDHVVAFDVVTGSGHLVRATPQENADLFWGLRGGKATLGIVTAVEIELPYIPEFYGGAVYFDGSDAAAVLHAWRSWSVGLPETVNTSIAIQQLPPLPGVSEPLAGRMTVAVRYTAVGDFAEAERLLAPMRAVATPLLDSVAVLPYAAIGAVHADPVDPMPVIEDQALLSDLPVAAVDALLAVAGPGSGSPQVIVELRMLGGAFARPAAHRSAFCHRNAAYALTVIGAPMPDTATMVAEHAAAVAAAVAPWSTGGQMPNFAPSYDPARPSRVYNDDTRHWLAALADRYDPARVLATGQVVR